MSTEDTEEVYLDVSLLDQKVRELIQANGANYDFKRAVENGTMVKMETEFVNACEQLAIILPMLRKELLDIAQQRRMRKAQHHHHTPEGSVVDTVAKSARIAVALAAVRAERHLAACREKLTRSHWRDSSWLVIARPDWS